MRPLIYLAGGLAEVLRPVGDGKGGERGARERAWKGSGRARKAGKGVGVGVG